MKRLLLIALTAILLLCACAPAQQPVKATQAGVIAPDTSQATPTTGYAIVRRFEGMQSLRLHSQPSSNSPETGRVGPGEKGKVMGLNATGNWVLVQFPDQSGWAPLPTLELVIAQ